MVTLLSLVPFRPWPSCGSWQPASSNATLRSLQTEFLISGTECVYHCWKDFLICVVTSFWIAGSLAGEDKLFRWRKRRSSKSSKPTSVVKIPCVTPIKMSQAFTTVRYWLRFRIQGRASKTKSLLELTSLFIIISTCNSKYVYIIFFAKIWKVFLILIKYRQHAKPQPSVGHCARTKSHVSRWKVTIKRLSAFHL